MSLTESARRGWRRWEDGYRGFARMRGFSTFNDWPYHRRGFVECWAEPGFHRFWQVWNPGIAYFVYRLYLRLGGRRHWAVATLASFVACGMAHTVAFLPFSGRWSYTVVVAFASFGLMTVVSGRLRRALSQERWPTPFNVFVNVAGVVAGFDLGFRADRLLCAWLH